MAGLAVGFRVLDKGIDEICNSDFLGSGDTVGCLWVESCDIDNEGFHNEILSSYWWGNECVFFDAGVTEICIKLHEFDVGKSP